MIAAEGEHKASRSLRLAAEVIADSPAALQVGRSDLSIKSKRVSQKYRKACLKMLRQMLMLMLSLLILKLMVMALQSNGPGGLPPLPVVMARAPKRLLAALLPDWREHNSRRNSHI